MYVVVIDGKTVETAATEDQARLKAEEVQKHASRYLEDDETGGAFAVVGYAPAADPSGITYLKPRASVPDALKPGGS